MMWVRFCRRRASVLAVVAPLVFTCLAGAQTVNWTGAAAPDNTWFTPHNWLNDTPPTNGATVAFDANSAQNLATSNNFAILSLNGITVTNPAGAISIAGNSLTINNGGIDLSAATQPLTIALGPAQTLTLGSSQTWKVATGQTVFINSPIAGDPTATLTFGVTNLTSGSSGTYQLLAPNVYTGNTVVGGPASTYVIGTNTPFGVGGTVNFNSFNTAPTLVTTNGARTLDNPLKWNSGFALGSASTGNLTLNGPITFGGDVGGQTNRTINNTSASLTVTVNGNIILGDPTITPTTHNRTLTLTSVTGGSVVVNGVISDPTSPTNTDNGGLTKSGTGPATLNNVANTYSGLNALQNGVLEVMAIADAGQPSSLGTGSTDGRFSFGNAANTGALRYIGPTNASTNRVINLAGTTGGGTIDASGGGTLTFTSNLTATGAGSKTLTLTGTNTGANTIAGAIVNNSATNKTSLVKSGAGTWVLSGANTYTGNTTVSAGTLILSGSIATSGSLIVTGGTAQFGADQDLKGLDVQKGNAGTQSLDLNNHSAKINAADLNAAQSTLASQLAIGNTDGIYDSTNAANTAVGYTIVNNAYVLAKKTLLGDATVDGTVDFNDLVALAQNYGGTGKFWPQGDFTRDGNVDFNDLVDLAQNYGGTLPASPIPGATPQFAQDAARAFAAIPEPSAVWIPSLALIVTQTSRRRGR